MDLNREARKLTDDFKEKTHRFVEDFTIAESLLDSEYEEEQRLRRMVEIHYKANDVRVARCEAKMKEVGGQQAFLDLIESGKWSDAEGMTEIEQEYLRLRNEQFHLDWFRKYGKPYRMEDDPNAKF